MTKSISNDYMTEKFELAAAAERIAKRIAERAEDASDEAASAAMFASTFDLDTLYKAMHAASEAARLWDEFSTTILDAIQQCEAGELEFQNLNACPCGDWNFNEHDCGDN